MASDVGAYEPTWLAGGGLAGGSSSGSSGSYETPAGRNGWDLLLAGDVNEAQRAFDRERLNVPGDGLPQIGQAITAGLLERYEEAVAAMRKALRDDPDALNEVPQNSQIADQIRALLTHYRNITREKPEDIDALFMTAALRHLLQEDALAYFAIDKAIDAGDSDDIARMLKSVIQRALDAQPDPAVPIPPGTSPATPEPAGSSPGDRQF